MRKKLGTACMALGLVLLLAAAALLAYNRWDDWRAGQSVAGIQDALEAAEEEYSDSSGIRGDGEDISGDGQDIIEDGEMNSIEIDGYGYIGTLSIPSYGLELPVMAEWSYPGLKIAPGRYSGSVWNSDLIICGHNYTRHFGNLRNLEPGDTLYFTDVNGNVFYYEVEETVILRPTDVEEMMSRESGGWDLTLFTCTIGGQTRVTVRCSRTD
ncbi:MAG: sortase [Clostridiales bacterium]|nr:sortase [Clostridiales bacterium]